MAEDYGVSEQATPEQLRYAAILDKGMSIGLVILLITFFLYITGIINPHIPIDEMSAYWSMPVSDYLHQADVHAGWSWVNLVHKGDFLNFVGIAFLAAVTIVCYLAIVPILWKNNDRVYAVLATLEAIVLTVAASGILGAGGH